MPRQLRPAWVSPEVLDQILLVGREKAPDEACGIVAPDLRVSTLPNVAPNCSSSYAVDEGDLVESIIQYLDRTETDESLITRGHFIIWHTHPGGQIGPSRGDLEHRLDGFQYLVVALPNGEATIF